MDNIKNQFNSFDSQIVDIVRNAEKQKWANVPNQDTNTNEQIFKFAYDRFAYLDKLMLQYL